jgi:hypothetical protein
MQDAKYIWETWVFSGSMVNFRTKRELFCSFFLLILSCNYCEMGGL